ncbi:MAG TPA: SusC/RagA family TonB-linked outer membrane protein, partial [Prevotella sp.]
MEKRLTMILACLFLSLGMAWAQMRVNGIVISSVDNEPIIGASVKVVGTNTGAATNVDGKFSLIVPADAKLEISYIGMKSKVVAAKSDLQVTLDPDDQTLDEVMVVAYGTAKKSSFTGSAQGVDNKKMELRPITSATKALEGNVSGVLMTSGTGQPGTGASIRIRGFGSIKASNDPLYVVDGIPYDGALNSINPSDIESMTVLKDASAGALYGARGANGVVMITTKKGKEGKPLVTWRSTVGWSSRALKEYDNVSPTEYVQLMYEALRNDSYFNGGTTWAEAEAAGRTGLSAKLGGELYNPFKNYAWGDLINPQTGLVREDAAMAWNENWMDAITKKNAFRHEHQLSVTGGTQATQWLISMGYLNEDGILKTTNFQRYSGRANISSTITDWFSANMNLSLAHSVSNYSQYDEAAVSNVWFSGQFASPLFPVYIKNLDGTDAL